MPKFITSQDMEKAFLQPSVIQSGICFPISGTVARFSSILQSGVLFQITATESCWIQQGDATVRATKPDGSSSRASTYLPANVITWITATSPEDAYLSVVADSGSTSGYLILTPQK